MQVLVLALALVWETAPERQHSEAKHPEKRMELVPMMLTQAMWKEPKVEKLKSTLQLAEQAMERVLVLRLLAQAMIQLVPTHSYMVMARDVMVLRLFVRGAQQVPMLVTPLRAAVFLAVLQLAQTLVTPRRVGMAQMFVPQQLARRVVLLPQLPQ